MSSLFLSGGTLVHLDPPLVQKGNLRVVDGRIDAAGPHVQPRADEQVVSMKGRLILPGLVVGHHHLYSALARGMPGPADPPATFHETLQRVWWRLDRSLNPYDIELSAWVGLMDAVGCGATCVIDHHASPSCVPDSLDRVADPFRTLRVRGVLCYEVSDRDGTEVRDQGVAENRRFAGASDGDDLLAATTGAHAAFTITDETLSMLAEVVRDTGAPLHIHLAEDPVDRDISTARAGQDPLSRLEAAGLLGGAILAHGVHLSDDEVQRVLAGGATLVHSPRSNINNRVGYGRPWRFGPDAALGTDGMDGDILGEARTAFLAGRDAGAPDPVGLAFGLIVGAQRLAARLTRQPLGQLRPGFCADLTILRYDPPTPLETANLAGHLLFGITARHVESVMVDGRFVLREGRFRRAKPASIQDKARVAARALWERMLQLEGR